MQYVLHMSLQYGELRPTSGCDRFTSLGYPCKFQQLLRLGSVTARQSSRAWAKLCGIEQRAPPMFGRVAITFGIFWTCLMSSLSSTVLYKLAPPVVTQLAYFGGWGVSAGQGTGESGVWRKGIADCWMCWGEVSHLQNKFRILSVEILSLLNPIQFIVCY